MIQILLPRSLFLTAGWHGFSASLNAARKIIRPISGISKIAFPAFLLYLEYIAYRLCWRFKKQQRITFSFQNDNVNIGAGRIEITWPTFIIKSGSSKQRQICNIWLLWEWGHISNCSFVLKGLALISLVEISFVFRYQYPKTVVTANILVRLFQLP